MKTEESKDDVRSKSLETIKKLSTPIALNKRLISQLKSNYNVNNIQNNIKPIDKKKIFNSINKPVTPSIVPQILKKPENSRNESDIKLNQIEELLNKYKILEKPEHSRNVSPVYIILNKY